MAKYIFIRGYIEVGIRRMMMNTKHWGGFAPKLRKRKLIWLRWFYGAVTAKSLR